LVLVGAIGGKVGDVEVVIGHPVGVDGGLDQDVDDDDGGDDKQDEGVPTGEGLVG
jgi:hypothetical protein